MITVIKKIIIKKKKKEKTRKKNACPTSLEPGTYISTFGFYHKATRALSPYFRKKL